jgi:hypothetical protein
MRCKLTSCCIALLAALAGSTSIAQNLVDVHDNQETSTQTTDKFSKALESQLACVNTPEPARAVAALQRSGIIERRSYLNVDSVSYFHTRQPMTVWGLRVVSVFGFDFNPRIFQRGPGTAPPLTIGVVVSQSERSVKAKLSSLGLENISVGHAAELDVDSKRAKSDVLTEISCSER